MEVNIGIILLSRQNAKKLQSYIFNEAIEALLKFQAWSSLRICIAIGIYFNIFTFHIK